MSFTHFLWANYNVSDETDTNQELAGPEMARRKVKWLRKVKIQTDILEGVLS